MYKWTEREHWVRKYVEYVLKHFGNYKTKLEEQDEDYITRYLLFDIGRRAL